jgi:hypothetical protein
MRIVFDVVVIFFECFEKEFVFRMTDGFDYKTIVPREIEKRSGFSGRPEFGKDIFCGKGKEIICGIEAKDVFAKDTKDPWSIVFEFEIILGRGR